WHLDDEFGVVHVILGQKSVTQVDSALEVSVIGGHVVRADQVINASAWPANGSDHIIANFQFGHVAAYCLDTAETLMANDEEIKSRRSGPVFRGIDLFVGSIDTYTQNFNQHAAPIWHFFE